MTKVILEFQLFHVIEIFCLILTGNEILTGSDRRISTWPSRGRIRERFDIFGVAH